MTSINFELTYAEAGELLSKDNDAIIAELIKLCDAYAYNTQTGVKLDITNATWTILQKEGSYTATFYTADGGEVTSTVTVGPAPEEKKDEEKKDEEKKDNNTNNTTDTTDNNDDNSDDTVVTPTTVSDDSSDDSGTVAPANLAQTGDLNAVAIVAIVLGALSCAVIARKSREKRLENQKLANRRH